MRLLENTADRIASTARKFIEFTTLDAQARIKYARIIRTRIGILIKRITRHAFHWPQFYSVSSIPHVCEC